MEFGVDPERYTIVYSFVILKPASGSFMLTCASFQLYVYDNR